MANSEAEVGADEPKGLRRIGLGAAIGLAAGIAGLVLPVALILLATYSPGTPFLRGVQLIQVTAIMALAGAILFALALLAYRLGFTALRRFDPRFWTASILCMIGTVGVLLVVLAIAIAFTSSDVMANCIQGAPTHALTCLQAAAPLASYSALLGFWLLWLGGLGIVVGIALAAFRYTQGWFYGGAALYAMLLLGLIAPALGLLFPIGALTYPILAAPVLALLAPVTILEGSQRARRRN
ncbi:MAG: hypothetical protein L3K07_00210 [Thermoplasmata archaeon]|nr:hypothetical protein [Thermoplasmata archaeon]